MKRIVGSNRITIIVYIKATLTRPFAMPFLGTRRDSKGLALVLAPVEDGKYMRIGVVFGFSTERWSPEAMERKLITIL